MKQKYNNTELVAIAISNLCIPNLKKYEQEIVGIYLSPFTVGGKQKIEVVITYNSAEELELVKKSTSINELQIFMTVKNICRYNSNPNNQEEFKLLQDLKNGIIIYDPNETLMHKKTSINKNPDITPFSNVIELPDSLRKTVKAKVYSHNKNKRKN